MALWSEMTKCGIWVPYLYVNNSWLSERVVLFFFLHCSNYWITLNSIWSLQQNTYCQIMKLNLIFFSLLCWKIFFFHSFLFEGRDTFFQLYCRKSEVNVCKKIWANQHLSAVNNHFWSFITETKILFSSLFLHTSCSSNAFELCIFSSCTDNLFLK